MAARCVLGSPYDGLGDEAVLTVLSASVNWVALVLWTMNNARRWVFGWQTTLYIVLTIVTQVICALMLDLGTTRGAVMFGVWTNLALLVAHAIGGWYGVRSKWRVNTTR